LRKNPYHYFFSFFGLRENPFAVSPDPNYLFMTPQIQKAWDALAYGIQSREGIILLTGEAGTGKTTLINRLLNWLHERRMPTAFIFNSHLEPRHLFDFMLADFEVPLDPSWQGNALMGLSQWLPERCREGQIPVLIVDEAQGLPLHVLEEIRLLLNLETPNEKLLQIVLAGQPELEEKLKRPEMRHLKQRIAVRCKTGALTVNETHEYIQVRLNIAGASGKSIFSPDAINAVHAYSRGIPRVMNLLCEHALINAYAGNIHVVPARLVNEIAREFQFDQEAHAPSIQSRTTETPARVYEPLVFPEAAMAPVPAAVRSVTSPPETAVMLAFSATTEPIPILAAREQPAMSLPDRNEPVYTLRESDPPPVPLRRSNVGAVSNKAPKKTSEVNVSPSRQMIARVLATRPPIVMSPMIRSDLIKKARDLSEELYRAWTRIFDAHVLRQLAITVTSGTLLDVDRWSHAFSGGARSLQLWWQDARPAWQRMRGSLLDWLRQPLARQHSSTAHKPNTRQLNLWARLAYSFNLPRSWQRSHGKFQPVVLPSSQVTVNAPVRRWLRQPFRPSHLLHSTSRAAAQRNKMPSAL
jgi:general secretion pathway protein A